MCQSLFVNKVSDLQVFSREFCEISKNTFFYRKTLVAASTCSSFLKIFSMEHGLSRLENIESILPMYSFVLKYVKISLDVFIFVFYVIREKTVVTLKQENSWVILLKFYCLKLS